MTYPPKTLSYGRAVNLLERIKKKKKKEKTNKRNVLRDTLSKVYNFLMIFNEFIDFIKLCNRDD